MANGMTIEQALAEGLGLQRAGRLDEAERLYWQILIEDPHCDDAWHLLGMIAYRARSYAPAQVMIERAIAIKPDFAPYHANRGEVLQCTGRYDEAERSFRRALAIDPANAQAINGMALHADRVGDLDRAERILRHGITVAPEYRDFYVNLVACLGKQRRFGDAVAVGMCGIEIAADYPEIHWNTALNLLMVGDWARGWAEYEWRWACNTFTSPKRNYEQSQWRGEPLEGRTILIHAEQGLGDTIQFARYLPMVAEQGGRVIVLSHKPLAPLLASVHGVAQVVTEDDPLPAFDLHCPMMSLPLAFGTMPDTVPADGPYLRVSRQRFERFRAELARFAGVRVGICWQGSNRNPNNDQRSMAVDDLSALQGIDGITLVCLQKEADPSQSRRVTDCRPIERCHDFADTAALVAACDLIISVDTSVVHLAGALGKPTIALLPPCVDWRWGQSGDRSAWYPSMRLVRRGDGEAWSDVVGRVAATVREIASAEVAV
jgi:hypothetical protein